ncbi:MAG: transporter substrate-binding domain-containing protein [Candidatus Methanomethylophilaceae archaeon]
MNKKILAILMATVFILSSCGVMVSSADETDAAKRTLVVETSPDFVPYDYYYGSEFVGIDMDIIRAIGQDLGYEIQFKQNTFDYIIMSIESKKSDLGASGFTITDERKESVNFSIPYAEIKQVVVVKTDKVYTSEDDLNRISSWCVHHPQGLYERG